VADECALRPTRGRPSLSYKGVNRENQPLKKRGVGLNNLPVRCSISTRAKEKSMSMPSVRFPIVCPQCKRESLISLPVATVADGLVRGLLELQGDCGHRAWRATAVEREQIRQYLASPILEQQLDIATIGPTHALRDLS
jgi:hypothetical protein